MQSLLFYIAIIAFCFGIFVRSFFNIGLPFVLWAGVVAMGLWLVGRKKSEAFFTRYVMFFAICTVFFSIGLLRMDTAVGTEVNEEYESMLDTLVTLDGTVVREPDIRKSSQHLYVKIEDELLLVTTDRYAEVSYGDSISFTGKIAKPKSFETDLGRTFDYPGYLHARGVSYVVSFAKITVKEHHQGNIVISKLLQIKHAFMTRIEVVMTEPYVGLGEGLLLGVSEGLGDDLEDAFRKTGIIHIVVLSGYNIMLVVLFVMYLLAFVLPLRLRFIFGAVSILLFACIVGFSATVMRASAMALLLLIAQATSRTYAVLRALMVTGVAMLLLNPYLLVYDVGFQFSFVATLGLILVSPYLSAYVAFMPTRFKLREFLTATLATQIFITPILLYQMGQFSVVAVVVNLIVLPMVPVAMLLTFLTGLFGFISVTVSTVLGFFAYLSLAYIIGIAEKFAGLSFSSFVVPTFPFYIVVIMYVLYAYILWRLYIRSSTHRVVVDTPLTLENWTIVEESLLGTPKETASDTPVFFR